MNKTAQMLQARREEIQKEIQEKIRTETQRIKSSYGPEMRDIQTALTALGIKDEGQGSLEIGAAVSRYRKRAKTSINEEIDLILTKHAKGLKNAEITEILNKQYGRNLKTTDVSWYLSNLKRKGELTLVNEVWKKV